MAENKQTVAIFGVHVELLDCEAHGAGLIRCFHYADKHGRCWLEPDHPPPVLFIAHDPDTRITLATCSSLSALPDRKNVSTSLSRRGSPRLTGFSLTKNTVGTRCGHY